MKKLPLFCTLYFVLCIGTTFGFTSEDTSNANYLADQGVITKQSTASKYRLDDKILRQEVIGMALKVKGITLPENYTCKKYFADATKNDWVCRAVELAADNGIISRSNKYANPGKSITRAEALAMVMKAGGLSDQSPLIDPGKSFIDANSWQTNLLRIAEDLQLVEFLKKSNGTEMGGQNLYFYPNRLATRAEVFGFAKNIVIHSKIKIVQDTSISTSICDTLSIEQPYTIDKGEFIYCIDDDERTNQIVMRVKGFDTLNAKYKGNYAHNNGVTVNLGGFGCCGMGYGGMTVATNVDFNSLQIIKSRIDDSSYTIDNNDILNVGVQMNNPNSFLPISASFFLVDNLAYIAFNSESFYFENPIPVTTTLAKEYVSDVSNFVTVDNDQYSFFHNTLFAILNNINIGDKKYENYTFGGDTKELRILRNAVYAKYGRSFSSDELQDFFDSQSWYSVNPAYSDAMLNATDKANIAYIQNLEK